MPAFRFRAQPALDLRRREHDAAQRALARADAERHQARTRLEAGERAIARARDDADRAARTGAAGHDREWYRFWIVRLDRERAALQADCDRAEAAVHVAQAACLETKRRCEALERFRDKALAAHRAAEDAEERKIIDDLATQRFALRERAQGA